jgi:hypothetical protein
MPFIPAPNTVKVVIIGVYDGQEVVNVLHYQKTSAVVDADVDTIMNDVKTQFETYVVPLLSQSYGVVMYGAQDLTNANAPLHTHVNSPVVAGSVSNAPLPGNVAVCATKRTAHSGRSYRGRIYVPGITIAAQSTPDSLGATFITNLLSGLGHLLTHPATLNFLLSVVSNYALGAARTQAVVTPVTALSMDTSIDGQRRRLIGRGA